MIEHVDIHHIFLYVCIYIDIYIYVCTDRDCDGIVMFVLWNPTSFWGGSQQIVGQSCVSLPCPGSDGKFGIICCCVCCDVLPSVLQMPSPFEWLPDKINPCSSQSAMPI